MRASTWAILVFVFLTVPIFGKSLEKELANALVRRIQSDYPFVSTNDISVTLQSKSSIPTGQSFAIDLTQVQSALGLVAEKTKH